MADEHFYTPGADYNFNQALTAIVPMLAGLLSAAVLHEGIHLIFHAESFKDVFVLLSNTLFRPMGRGLASSALFVFSFFGAVAAWHSPEPNVLEENVSRTLLFGRHADQCRGGSPRGRRSTAIFTKTFLDNPSYLSWWSRNVDPPVDCADVVQPSG